MFFANDEKLTGRQMAVFQFVFDFTKKNGYQPTVTEVANKFGINTSAVTTGYYAAFRKKGWIGGATGQGKGRALRAMKFLRRPDGSPFKGFD